MVAGDIVPDNAVFVDIIQNTHAGFWGLVDTEFCIVRLGCTCVSRLAPGLITPSIGRLVGVGHLGVGVRPEPTFDIERLQVLSLIASSEVTQAARGPNVFNVTVLDKFEDHFVLRFSLQTNSVHAPLAADVPSGQPIKFLGFSVLQEVGVIGNVEAEEVPMATVCPLDRTFGAFLWNWF